MGIFDFFRKKSPESAAAVTKPAATAQESGPPDSESADVSQRQRDAYWESIGSVEPDVIAFLISPQLTGGVAWPTTRQSYKIIRRGSSTIIASDGMSDPFHDTTGMGNGFGMEMFIETSDIPEIFAGKSGNVADLASSWAYIVLRHVCDQVADAGGITAMLEKYGIMSMELPGVSERPELLAQLPAKYISADDGLGILIGGPAPDFATSLPDMPLSPVTMVPIVLVTADELKLLGEGGAAARKAVAEQLVASGTGHISSLKR